MGTPRLTKTTNRQDVRTLTSRAALSLDGQYIQYNISRHTEYQEKRRQIHSGELEKIGAGTTVSP